MSLQSLRKQKTTCSEVYNISTRCLFFLKYFNTGTATTQKNVVPKRSQKTLHVACLLYEQSLYTVPCFVLFKSKFPFNSPSTENAFVRNQWITLIQCEQSNKLTLCILSARILIVISKHIPWKVNMKTSPKKHSFGQLRKTTELSSEVKSES